MKDYDVVVVGGGIAGVAAALGAARQGVKVLLIEKSNALGGAAVTCLVNPFMPYWTMIDNERYSLSRGIFEEIIKGLNAFGAVENNYYVFHEEYLKILLNRMVLSAGIDLLFHSYLIDAEKTGSDVKSVTVANKSGKQAFSAKCFIDATGDADLAVLSGVPCMLGRAQDNLCQPMTLCFRIANVDLEKYKKSKPRINELYKKLQAEGKIKNIRENVLIFRNLVKGVLHFNSTRIVKLSPVDAFDKTRAEIEAREQVLELYNFLKDNIDGFEDSDLMMTAAEIGVRESRKIRGLYLLNQEDLMSCKKFEDSIALGNYDIDIHNPEGSGTSHYYWNDGEYYSIPYRSLVPQNVTNLLVAGRCISATHEAQASIRIMPIVCCIGEAAGVAAAVACHDNSKACDVNVKKVQMKLEEQGAVIR